MKYNWFAEQKITKSGLKRKERIEGWKLNQLLKFAKRDARLLEIGPGIGIFAKLCREKGLQYSAIEPNTKLYDELVKRNFAVKKTSVPPIPYPDSSFDVVYIDQLLEHMSGYKEAVNLIEESYRVLAAKGFLCIIVPNYLTERDLFFDIDYTHSFVTTERRASQMLYDNGFSTILSKKYLCGLTGWPANLLNILFIPMKWEFTRLFFGEPLWLRIRKNLFELLIIIGQK